MSAQECAQPGKEFFQRERFDEIVVGPCVESGDAVGDAGASREHENRDLVALRPDQPTRLESVETGHADIENDDIGRLVGEKSESISSRRGNVDSIPFGPECA